jgi:hypothetical protein
MVTGFVCDGGRSGSISMEELEKALKDVPQLVLAESVEVCVNWGMYTCFHLCL